MLWKSVNLKAKRLEGSRTIELIAKKYGRRVISIRVRVVGGK